MAEPKLEAKERLDRLELAVGTMAQWLVQAQTGFGAHDAEGIERILRGEKVEKPKAKMSLEEIAKAFHEAYERLAPEHNYETRKASAVLWEEVPEQNRFLMIAVVHELIDKGVIKA